MKARPSKMVNIRLPAEDAAELQQIVDEANDRVEEIGLPRSITLTAIVRGWIREKLDAREGNGTKRVYRAPHVNAAQDMLRKNRR